MMPAVCETVLSAIGMEHYLHYQPVNPEKEDGHRCAFLLADITILIAPDVSMTDN